MDTALNYFFIRGISPRWNLWRGTFIDLFNVRNLLLGRGFEGVIETQVKETLISPEANEIFEKDGKWGNNFIELFNQKDFRIQIRDMIFKGKPTIKEELKPFFFEQSGLNENRFAKTLELLIAYLCVKELEASSASFGISIKNAPYGGDYDCIANFQNSIFNFEVKSGNISNLKPDTIQKFLDRHAFLAPQASILFLDYTGGADKLDQVILQFKNRMIGSRKIDIIKKIKDGTKKFYAIESDVLVIDIHSDGNILSNLRLAMQYIHRYNAYSKSMVFNLVDSTYLGYESVSL